MGTVRFPPQENFALGSYFAVRNQVSALKSIGLRSLPSAEIRSSIDRYGHNCCWECNVAMDSHEILGPLAKLIPGVHCPSAGEGYDGRVGLKNF